MIKPTDYYHQMAAGGDGLYAIAIGLYHIAEQIELLGNGEAYTGEEGIRKGAIEALGMELSEAIRSIDS